MVILYGHLIIWPQTFREGQVVPYTIFAPVMFVYEDQDLLASMSGGGQGVQWAVDFSRKQEALDRLDGFATALRKLRQQYLHAPANDQEIKGRTCRTGGYFGAGSGRYHRLTQIGRRFLARRT